MKKILITALPLLVLAGCYPGGAEYTEELDAVYTTYDDKYDFQAQSTYARPDKIVIDVEIDRGDTTYVYMKDVFATPILQAIDANMESNGWTRVLISQTPDVLITPAAIKSTTYFYSYWYDWWYGGWYGGYWGWYYPPYYTVSSYTTGSVIISMSDPNAGEDSPINQSQAAWLAVMNGLYTGTNDSKRVTTAINDAFAQSPYLKTN
jgi:hypothetical protein